MEHAGYSDRARMTCILKAIHLETTSYQLVLPQNSQPLCPSVYSVVWYEKLSKTVPVSAVLNNYWKNAMYGRNSSFSLKLMESIAVGVFGWNYSAQQWIRKVYM